MRSLLLVGGAVVVLLLALLTQSVVSAAAPVGPAASSTVPVLAQAKQARPSSAASWTYRERPRLPEPTALAIEQPTGADQAQPDDSESLTNLVVYDRNGSLLAVEVYIYPPGFEGDRWDLPAQARIYPDDQGQTRLPLAHDDSRRIVFTVGGFPIADTTLERLSGRDTKVLTSDVEVVHCRLLGPDGEPVDIRSYSVFRNRRDGTGRGRGGGGTGSQRVAVVWPAHRGDLQEIEVSLQGDDGIAGSLTLMGPGQRCEVQGQLDETS